MIYLIGRILTAFAMALSLLALTPSLASAETRLETHGAVITWDEKTMFLPQPTTVLNFNYANFTGVNLLTLKLMITDPYGTLLLWETEVGVSNGTTGSWSNTLYYFDVPSQGYLGPYTATIEIKDYSNNVRSATKEFYLLARPPGITTMSPLNGVPGTKVSLTGGVGLNSVTSLTLNGLSVPFTKSNIFGIYSVNFFVPAGATSGSVVLTNPGGTADAGQFTVNIPAPAPAVTTPAVTTPAVTTPAVTTPASGILKGSRLSGIQVAALVGAAVPNKAKVTLSVSKKQKKVCLVKSNKLVAKSAGLCNVKVTIKPKKGKKTASSHSVQIN
jgi:hypothetical protein